MAAAHEKVQDDVVFGDGPAGSSRARWLADAEWEVAAVVRKYFLRIKTCDEGLTLAPCGSSPTWASKVSTRIQTVGQSIEMPCPPSTQVPHHYTTTRYDLDGLVAARAVRAGATLLTGATVAAPVIGEAASPSIRSTPCLVSTCPSSSSVATPSLVRRLLRLQRARGLPRPMHPTL